MSYKREDLISWEVDYGDADDYQSQEFKTVVNLSGLNLMLINDSDGIFYPVL